MYDMIEKDLSGQRYQIIYGLDNISAPKASGSSNNIYEVKHPITGLPCKTPTRGWGFTMETMNEHIKNNLIYFYEDHNHVPRFKRYLHTVESEVLKSFLIDNTDGKKELIKIFGQAPFNNAKPTTLIKYFCRLKKEDIFLDFFAGSGTTGQAIEELNHEDGGKRQFIVATNNENEICQKITYPRLQKTIKSNLIVYKTLLVPHNLKPTDDDKLLLSLHAGELIGLKEETHETIEINSYYHLLNNHSKTKCTLIYFNEDLYK
jgi:adenine-specific DNA-methyltransferase